MCEHLPVWIFVHVPAEAGCVLCFFKIKEFTGGTPDFHYCDNSDYVFYFRRCPGSTPRPTFIHRNKSGQKCSFPAAPAAYAGAVSLQLRFTSVLFVKQNPFSEQSMACGAHGGKTEHVEGGTAVPAVKNVDAPSSASHIHVLRLHVYTTSDSFFMSVLDDLVL